MLVQHYAHRLPSDYPTASIRERVAARAPLWSATPGLGFKAFLLRHRGQDGAAGTVYASAYLWRDAAAACAFFTDDRFASVIEAFGRPTVETMLPLAVRVRGDAEGPRLLTRSDTRLGPDEDLRRLRRLESEGVAHEAARPGVAAVVSAFDPASWTLTRYVLSRDPIETPGAVVYEIAYLARPGWAQLAAEGA